MVPNSPQVRQVALGEGGIASAAKPGTVLIDMSSINPVASKEIAAELEKRGIEMLDAPVSGGEPKAVDGTLAFMVGGKPELFEKFKPIAPQDGRVRYRCGGAARATPRKLCNQIVVASNIAAVAEALIGQKAGRFAGLVYQAIRGGLAGSTSHGRQGADDDGPQLQPGFKIDLHIKDLNNVLDAGALTSTRPRR